MAEFRLTEGEGYRDGLLGDRHIFRYVFQPPAPESESPRPYFHPLRTLGGNLLTLYRPTDHPWHHALSMTLTKMGSTNFWGGPTFQQNSGYQYRGDHGRQVHRAWLSRDSFVEELEWLTLRGKPLIEETRRVTVPFHDEESYILAFEFCLKNISGESQDLGTYQSLEGLAGSHYSGLQFRLVREFLTPQPGFHPSVMAAGDATGVAAIHGGDQSWMALVGNHDVTLRKSTVAFWMDAPSPCGGPNWFVRENPPLAACPFLGAEPYDFQAEEVLSLRCCLLVADGALDPTVIRARASERTYYQGSGSQFTSSA